MIRISKPAMALCRDTVKQLAGAQTDSKCLRLLQRNGVFSIVHHHSQSIFAVPRDAAENLAGKTLELADDGNLVIA